MTHRIVRRVAALAFAAAAACRQPGVRRQDARLLLRRKPRRLQPAVLHHRHHRRCVVGADLQPPGRVRDRHDQHRARAGRELDRRGRRPELHLPPEEGREVPQQRQVHADPRLQRRRRAVLVQPPGRPEPSLRQGDAGPDLRVLRGHGHEGHRRSGREGRPDDGALRAEEAGGAVHGRHGDGLRLHPLGRVRRQDDGGEDARRRRQGADRHRPVPVRLLPEGRGDPLQGLRRSTGTAGRRSTTWSTRSPPTPRSATPS